MIRILLLILLLTTAACSRESSFESPPAQVTVSGRVTDERGQGLSGVIVSDGMLCTLSDGGGYYALESDLGRRRFIQVTIPAGYQIPDKDGIPQFWQRIPAGAQAPLKADFRLTKRHNSGQRYTILMTADPQIRSKNAAYDKVAYHSISMYEDLCRDVREYAASITDRPVYSICLGDLIHNDPTMWPTYRAGVKSLGIPVFSVIGNHDHLQDATNDALAAQQYEEWIGPTNYSVDLGAIHYVFVDNIIMQGGEGAYKYGLTDEAYSWLCNDLKLVDKNKQVMVCAHSAMFRKQDSESTQTDLRGPEYAARLSQFRFVHAWSGHAHTHFNYVYSKESAAQKYPNVESHIVARSTGALWLNERLSSDGTPRGYIVLEIDGERISWQYRNCGYENGAPLTGANPSQIRAYAPDVYNKDGYVYANIWGYDALWSAVCYNDGGKSATMTAANAFDPGYGLIYNRYASTGKASEPVRTPHLFRIQPASGARSATITTTDRFGQSHTTDLNW